MGWRNTAGRYGSLSIGLHWLMLLLLAAVYACIELREFYPRGSDVREGLKAWHFMLGLTVLGLALARLAVRIAGPVPAIPPAVSLWQQRSARAVHIALYALMLAMPTAGWLILSAEGEQIRVFGMQLPALVPASDWLAQAVQELHETGGAVGYWLIGLHAAAALFHHYVSRDNTLRRMLPWQRS